MKKSLDRFTRLTAILVIVLMAGCSKDTQPVQNAVPQQNGVLKSLEAPCGSSTCPLYAGQTMNWGTLTVANDELNLYVTYTATTGTFGALQLWAGTDLSNLPMAGNGNPIPGQFPYSFDATGLSTYSFTIPLANVPFLGACPGSLYVIAHAEMVGPTNETAYGGCTPVNVGKQGGNGKWYYIFNYTTFCCGGPGGGNEPTLLGTGFAKGGYVFTTDKKSNPEGLPTLGLTKNRWGWAINLKSAGTTAYPLWVGAGLNYTSKGMLVGSVKIDWTGTQATVTYLLNAGYTMEEAHVYAGDFKPTKLAPGQYGNIAYFIPFVNTYSFTVDVSDSGIDGIWFIVHAVVWGPGVVNVI